MRAKLNLGGSVGTSLCQTVQVRVSYAHGIAHNEARMQGQSVRIMLIAAAAPTASVG